MARHSRRVGTYLRIAATALDRIDHIVDPAEDRIGPELGDIIRRARRLQAKVRFHPSNLTAPDNVRSIE